jgi:hypothetical protein
MFTTACHSKTSSTQYRLFPANVAGHDEDQTSFTPTRHTIIAAAGRLPPTQHQAPHSAPRHREYPAPWSAPLGRRTQLRLAQSLSTLDGPIRATGRHSCSVHVTRLFPDLLSSFERQVLKWTLNYPVHNQLAPGSRPEGVLLGFQGAPNGTVSTAEARGSVRDLCDAKARHQQQQIAIAIWAKMARYYEDGELKARILSPPIITAPTMSVTPDAAGAPQACDWADSVVAAPADGSIEDSANAGIWREPPPTHHPPHAVTTLPLMPAAPGAGAFACNTSEDAREMTLIGEAANAGYLHQRRRRVHQ